MLQAPSELHWAETDLGTQRALVAGQLGQHPSRSLPAVLPQVSRHSMWEDFVLFPGGPKVPRPSELSLLSD